MVSLIPEATAYLERLEADRRAAIAISEQKAEEAKLIGARQEGFQAAMEILTSATSIKSCARAPSIEVCEVQSDKSDRISATSINSCKLQAEESGRRRPRRDIIRLILSELSFSGQAMTTAQIAKAIDYIPERTETALKRLETGEKVVRDERGRWTAVVTSVGDNWTPYAVVKASDIGPPVVNSAVHSARNLPVRSVKNTDSSDR
jgi:hypothetical protein